MSTSTRPKRSRPYLKKPEVDLLLAAAKDPSNSRNPVRNYAILLLMFRHGLRVSELCGLRLSDIDVETRELHVNRLKDCDSGPHDMLNGEPQAVKAWLVERAKMKPPANCETLFISERCKPLWRSAVWAMIVQLAKAAGMENLAIHPHMLRHSTGYAMINSGNDVRIIQGYLGHRSITSTVRYTKLNKSQFKGIKGLV